MQIEKQRPTPGAGLRILTETVTSPTLTDQITKLLQALPGAKWHQYEPINRDAVFDGARIAFGRPVETQYKFDQADVVLSLDADFFSYIPGHLRYIRDFVSRRKVRTGSDNSKMSRLYVIESAPSITGAVSDHRHCHCVLLTFLNLLKQSLQGWGSVEAQTMPAMRGSHRLSAICKHTKANAL